MSRQKFRFFMMLTAALTSVIMAGAMMDSFAADQLEEKWQKRVNDVETNYLAILNRANNTRMYSLQKANLDRIKLLKTILSDATRAGDMVAINAVKDKISSAETAFAERTKPKGVVKFGGHEYALGNEKLTWHSAKRACEEMGGHLVTFDSPAEQAFVLKNAATWNTPFWIGLSNEGDLARWTWVNGKDAVLDSSVKLDDPNRQFFSSAVCYWVDSRGLNDHNLGAHIGYVCEWD